MLKKRIIPQILIKNKRAVKGQNFASYVDVGDPLKLARTYYDQDSDEVLIINLDNEDEGFEYLLDVIERVSSDIHIPITCGGGIRTIGQVDRLFRAGADRLSFRHLFFKDPCLLKEISDRYGAQSLVVALDYRSSPRVDGPSFLHGTEEICSLKWEEILVRLKMIGIGEVLLQAVDRDGTMTGFDLEVLKDVKREIPNIPIIASCGAGKTSHVAQAFRCGIDAVCLGSIFVFADNNPFRIKARLRNDGFSMRKGVIQ